MHAATSTQPTAANEPDRRRDPDEEPLGLLREIGVLLPAQVPGKSYRTPELRLVAAVLAQAIADVRWPRSDPHGQIRADALRWLRSDDGTWPYGFVRICEMLHLEPAWVRQRVNGWVREGIPAQVERGSSPAPLSA
ncbi:MAG TPA: hypothetical protein VL049_06700 [Candidatus Dormibacteraeota bacterium]|nr:hypothetical protein [Candidatus Dormibacteraeota bacterium]